MELSERISGLEARLTKPSAVEQCLLSALKLMEEGFSIAASGQLDALIERTKPAELTESLPVILASCFIVERLDLIARLLEERFCGSGRLNVEVSSEMPRFFVVLFKKTAEHEISLTFSDQLSQAPTLVGQMSWLIWVMPLLGLVAVSGRVAPGQTYLNQWDAGIFHGLAYCANDPNFFLIPDNVFLPTMGYQSLKETFSSGLLDWSQRKCIAFWRGSTTGQETPPKKGWRSLPRIRLCEISVCAPMHVDAGITKIVQRPDHEVSEISNSGYMKEFFPASQLQKYQYLIDIDGNSNAWGGLFERLVTGSPVLKVGSEHGYRQWYYDRLRPWHNFVPILSDMSDLIEKVKWLKLHDDDARKIGENGRNLALSLDYKTELDSALDTVSASFRAFKSAKM